ncbi:MAG: carboxypeptidase regulatory-like domain-containing protein [Myxococcales bacterium]|nr:carboxypeptidase regulatory-like domain-containing protein [Myxococcales bacterium]
MRAAGPLLSTIALGVALALVGACKNHRAVWPRNVAHGAPSTCPENKFPPLGDTSEKHIISPDLAKCTYTDALGASVLRVSGKVLTASDAPGDPGTGVPDVIVTVHRVDNHVVVTDPGPRIAKSITTAQGNYSISSPFTPGRYLLIVHDRQTDAVLAHRILEIAGSDIEPKDDFHITIPVDPSLQAP